MLIEKVVLRFHREGGESVAVSLHPKLGAEITADSSNVRLRPDEIKLMSEIQGILNGYRDNCKMPTQGDK